MDLFYLQTEHLEDVLKIETACFSVPWSRASFEEQIDSPFAVFLIGYEKDEPVGFIGMQHILEIGDITNVAVLPAFRGRGIGTQFLQEMEKHAILLGVEVLLLEVRVSNEVAIQLYKKSGFEAIGSRKNYYSKPVEDAIVMRKYLAAAKKDENN